MKAKNKRIIKRLAIFAATIFFLCIAILFTLFFGVKQGWWGHVPDIDELLHINNHQASIILAADKTILDKVYDENRTIVPLKNIPQAVIDALIATEDSRFFEHQGVDFVALSRVLFRTLILRQSHAGGGSTISQQLAKNLFGRKGHGRMSMLLNKLSEMVTAQRLEEIYSKDEIIALYLNTVSFGDNVFGIENAALHFYSRHSKQLNLNQACVLVGILKGNTLYNPRLNPSRALQRKNLILDLMQQQGYITKLQAEKNHDLGLMLNCSSSTDAWKQYGYFTDMVKRQAHSLINEYNKKHESHYNILTDGLTIKTTLDNTLQLYALAALNSHIEKLQAQLDKQLSAQKFWRHNKQIVTNELQRLNITDGDQKHDLILPYRTNDSLFHISAADSIRYMQSKLQAALLAIAPQTGAIKAWIGGRSFQYFPYDRVISQRQVGSTFKPIVYYTALQQGIDQCEYFDNQLKTYEDYEDWTPTNADSNYTGRYTMRGALAQSLNTITAQLIVKAGVDNTIATARKLGIKAELPQVPSIALGTAAISLNEMVQAYACIANKGKRSKSYCIEKITAPDGTVIYEHKKSIALAALEQAYCEQLTLMMQEVVRSGTAHRIIDKYACTFDLAAKTGTTQDNTDGWFIAFTPKLAMGVWVGCDNPALHFNTTAQGQGAATALPIWAQTMKKVYSSSIRSRYISPFEYQIDTTTNCTPYEETKDSFFKRLFGGKKNKETKPSDKSTATKHKTPASETDQAKPDEKKKKRGFGWWFRKREE